MKKFHAESIEDVISIMDDVIRNCRVQESRLGYFTVLYRTTTHMVKKHCDQGGFFNDDARMRQLDVAFANYYFDSLFAHLHYETPPSESWKVAFQAADDPQVVLMQHLLLGMNAHISLDLGVAAATIADGNLDDSLEHDFFLLNSVLASLINVVQVELGSVSPLLGWMNRLTLHFENFLVDHGIRFARSRAWHFAEKLNASPRAQWPELIAAQDRHVANISRRIVSPGWIFRPGLQIIRWKEKNEPHEIISGLAGESWYEAAHQKAMEVIGTTGDLDADFMKRETQLMHVVTVPSSQDPLNG